MEGNFGFSGPMFGENIAGSGGMFFGGENINLIGGGFLASQNVSAGTAAQGAWGRNTYLILKIGMINRAWSVDPADTHVRIRGIQVEHFRLLGHIRNVQKHDNKYVFYIDDGTGVIPCDYMLTDEVSPYKEQQMKELVETPEVYVKIYGAINLLGKKIPYVRAHVIRPISHPDEVTLHDVEVCHFILKTEANSDTMESGLSGISTRKVEPSDAMPPANNSANFAFPMKDSYTSSPIHNMGYVPDNSAQPSVPPSIELRRAIMQVLNENRISKDRTIGLHVKEIMLRAQRLVNSSALTEEQVRAALVHLDHEESLVCTTFNSDTYDTTSG